MIWPLPKFIMATGAVVDLLKKYQLTGVKIQYISDLGTNGLTKRIVGKLGPGHIHDWFEGEQADQLDAEIESIYGSNPIKFKGRK
jgi:hypothetical protein